MMIQDYGKLIILCIGLVGAFALFFAPDVDHAIPVAIIGPILGYVTGNGKLAISGKAATALIVAKDNPQQD